MSDSSYGSVLVEGVTYIDEREVTKRDAEIERLRELLGETYGYIHIPYGASHEDVAEISDVRQRVREALGR